MSFTQNKIRQSTSQGLKVLKPEDNFKFACHDGLDCFTQCCQNINIFLMPYDIIQLKNGLQISSEKFLQQYTITLMGKNGLPAIILKMKDDDEKSCPFVTAQGCRVYDSRPWACRIYPLQPETTKITEKAGRQYYSIMDVPFCLGFQENKVSIVREWIDGQNIPIYIEMEELFKKITMNEFLSDKKIENKKIQEMYFMACYDIDRFRRFIFESSFLKQFEIEKNEIEKMKYDDTALYKFAMKWIEFGLLGQQGLKLKPEVMAAKKKLT
ncbi:MAG: YkgJ family cysteine cluster protein [Desulfobacula sp.]|uniref:YkgJ family cysteine cluster protein n=1 Tax=Desulfobacula sp. TaxID=2593537 RepID=UPI0025C506C0|nr:YkgJ family cysteine cluster protein [Desulfobacula sp.]MCD4718797.1 YkgJ family cysteine cluster protein [Desulfobacula sp.]